MVRHGSVVGEEDFPNLLPSLCLLHQRKCRVWDAVLLTEARAASRLTTVEFKNVSPVKHDIDEQEDKVAGELSCVSEKTYLRECKPLRGLMMHAAWPLARLNLMGSRLRK